jgi:hypothetical protein
MPQSKVEKRKQKTPTLIQREKYNHMEGVITTENSKNEGRLKVGVSSRGVKKNLLKKLVGRGGPGFKNFIPANYGKVKSSPKISTTRISTGGGKKIKLPSATSIIKSLLKSGGASKFKISKTTIKPIKMSKIKGLKIKTVKGIVKIYS